MFIHYLRISWRNLWKNKASTIINVAGLATGLCCCLLMILYIQHELSYDRFQTKGDRIVRVIMEYGTNGTVSKGNYTSTKVMPSFARNFPEIETGVRMSKTARVIRYGDKLFNEKNVMFADSTFFRLFDFPLKQGNPAKALESPRQMVITESMARKYFGSENPVGKIMTVGSNSLPFDITGVMADPPSNSQIKFDFLASFSSLGAAQEQTYWNANYTTYLLLKNPEDIPKLQAKILPFMKKEMGGEMTAGDYLSYELEPMQRIHLHSTYEGFEPNNSITYVYMVGAVAFLMLLIACFTYINLSTARSVERAKEVGIRKVSGAERPQIFWQFINESLILTFIALVIAFAAASLLLPAFNHLASRDLQSSTLFSTPMLLSALGMLLVISLLAGSYPALVLSGFQPIRVLKGSFKSSGSGLTLRRSLIVFQFMISAFLIVSTFIIHDQLDLIRNKNLGYDRDQVLVLPLDRKMNEKMEAIKTEFRLVPGVRAISGVANDPTYIKGGYSIQTETTKEGGGDAVTANPVDEEFIKATGIQLIAGTDFTRQDVLDAEKDSSPLYHFILNQAAVKMLGWTPEEAIGKKVFLGSQRPGYVKGVVKDFNFASLHDPIKPLVLFNESWGSNLLVKLTGNGYEQALSGLAAKWKALVPHRPFEYTFLDENYNQLYESEIRIGTVFNLFSGIAILLACLGLFGLSAYTIQQRRKEIGVRKVLGASSMRIAMLLSAQFIRLVAIAFLIAAPISWWLMQRWLSDFAYRINIGWLVFVVTGLLLVIIALGAVSFQAIKAALSNPIKSLRTE